MALKQLKELTPEPPEPKAEPIDIKEEKPKEEAKEAPETGKDKGTTPEPEDRWAGKSLDELRQIVREQDSMIGKQSTVIDTQKKDLEYYEKQVTQAQTPQYSPQNQFQNPSTPQANPYGIPRDPSMGYGGYAQYNPYPGMVPQQEPPLQFNYENPLESVQTAVQRELARERQERQQQEQARYAMELRDAYQEGRHKAYKSNPDLFKGIERDVEGGMMAMVQRGLFYPSDLRREDVWEDAGKLARLRRNEFGYLKPKEQPTMAPPHTEVPASMKEEAETELELSEVERAQQKIFGLTDEEVREEFKRSGRIK